MRLHLKNNTIMEFENERKQKSSLPSSRVRITRVVIKVTVLDVRRVPVSRSLVHSLDSRAVSIAVKNKKRASVLRASEQA